jgi:YD repeat-containing protein
MLTSVVLVLLFAAPGATPPKAPRPACVATPPESAQGQFMPSFEEGQPCEERKEQPGFNSNMLTRYRWKDGRLIEYVNTSDPRLTGATFKYFYDDAGRLSSVEEPNQVTRFRWDACGRLVEQTMPLSSNLVIQYGYDEKGRLVSEKRVRDGVTRLSFRFEYANDQLLAAKSFVASGRSGGELRYHYTDGRRSIQETLDESGEVMERKRYSYDKAGRLDRIIEERANGEVTREVQHTYDAKGRLLRKEATHPRSPRMNFVTTYRYDCKP